MHKTLLLAVFLFLGMGSLFAQDLIEQLKPFEPYIGKIWKGKLSEPGSETEQYDISKWEKTLNGKAIRILHSVNNGAYGGETIIYYDAEIDSLIYYYFTTAGFYTHGKVWFEDGKFISHEYVTGNENGITEVKAIGEVLPDGKLKSTSQYYKKGEWVEGHTVIYEEAPDAEVKFK